MTPFQPNIAYGELIINGLSCHTYMFNLIDVRPLYVPTKYRGSNLVLPHASGKRAQPYRIDEAEHVLRGYFTPMCDEDGNPWSDRFVGYEENIGTITSAWLEPDTTFSASLITPSTDELVADVQVTGFDVFSTDEAIESPFVWKAALGLRIPTGRFT